MRSFERMGLPLTLIVCAATLWRCGGAPPSQTQTPPIPAPASNDPGALARPSELPPSHDAPIVESPSPQLVSAPPPADEGTDPCGLRSFRDPAEVCRHGILPQHPFGSCTSLAELDRKGHEPTAGRIVTSDDAPFEPELHPKPGRIEAVGGHAELFVKSYVGSGDSTQEDLYLGFERPEGTYVLLAHVASYDSVSDLGPPRLERFEGTDDGIVIELTRRVIAVDRPDEDEREVRNTLTCRRQQGRWQCSERCPETKARPAAPSCAAIAGLDAARFTPGVKGEWEGGRWDWYEAEAASDLLRHPSSTDDPEPTSVWELGPEGDPLRALGFEGSETVLLHGTDPLLYSEAPMRAVEHAGHLVVEIVEHGETKRHAVHVASHTVYPACVTSNSEARSQAGPPLRRRR